MRHSHLLSKFFDTYHILHNYSIFFYKRCWSFSYFWFSRSRSWCWFYRLLFSVVIISIGTMRFLMSSMLRSFLMPSMLWRSLLSSVLWSRTSWWPWTRRCRSRHQCSKIFYRRNNTILFWFFFQFFYFFFFFLDLWSKSQSRQKSCILQQIISFQYWNFLVRVLRILFWHKKLSYNKTNIVHQW